ncbi:MAG: hypothetical protein A3J83_09030 [Elusimicrobia bacterium RIFOXYA2_FULL_40_6]|nr:MAG: hypothetical protein A3J83_09030 [Elusimicrobia bacterium RIFOXYA2_FULL_40_6]
MRTKRLSRIFLTCGLLLINSVGYLSAFDVSLDGTFNVFNDERFSSQSKNLGIYIDLDDNMIIGPVWGDVRLNLKNEKDNYFYSGSAETFNIRTIMDLTEVNSFHFSSGLDLGWSNVRLDNGTNFKGTNQSAPIIDVFTGIAYKPKSEKWHSGTIFLNLGYRWWSLNSINNPFGANSKVINNLDGWFITFGIGL